MLSLFSTCATFPPVDRATGLLVNSLTLLLVDRAALVLAHHPTLLLVRCQADLHIPGLALLPNQYHHHLTRDEEMVLTCTRVR